MYHLTYPPLVDVGEEALPEGGLLLRMRFFSFLKISKIDTLVLIILVIVFKHKIKI